jgi:proline iminopeptidase
MRARIRDTEIYFDVDGAGLVPEGSYMRERPTAFLVHGGPGSDHTDLKVCCAPLAEKLQLVYFDHRGHGRSARGDQKKYTLDENVEDMEALRRYLGLGAIVSIGASYGGMVAMAHAARYPASVSHLVLLVTASHSGFIAKARETVAKCGTLEQIAMSDDLWAGRLNTPAKLRRYYEVMGSLYAFKHDVELLNASLDRRILFPDALNRAYAPDGCLRNFDLRPELRAITAHTLILAGRHDWICPPEFSEEIQRLIPGSELQIFEESSHSIWADDRQKVLNSIAASVVWASAKE